MDASAPTHPSWAEIEEATRSDAGSPSTTLVDSPAWHFDDTIVTDFGPAALDDEVEIVECADCHKPVLRDALSFHQQNCKLARDIASGRISPSILEGDPKKRRMMEDDDESIMGDDSGIPLTKKQKKEARLAEEKRKGGRKNKGPIDVDKQCGVINDKGLPCSRSLTCKSHSMGAKRAVEGRSAPYDTLLFEWQKATNPSFVAKLEEKEKAIAAAKAAAAAAPPKEKKKKNVKDAKTKGGAAGAGAAGAGVSGTAGGAAAFIEDDDMDMFDAGADEDQMEQELMAVLGSVAHSASRDRTMPLPLATRSFVGSYTSRAKRMRNLRELLREGLAPGGGAYGINGYATWNNFRPATYPPNSAAKKGVATGA
ncbi:SCA7-domain-containing protein [Moesziomyces antarcticus]|uniref:Related to SGF73 - SAGA complex subunit n=1 Tax=Pseudozyma antarctica TaxID=84753 RepID=A0A5C3FDR2_PSEA2|nr:SCA7-domain-containing protein [Moesziomyces antarcticus]GAK62036.1 SCA7-domain-containing protein [Moesziomyces antarcticus]SPO42564.1 related to SGF73 - SAGA complex subunit [Moesziomyces antarcticus]